MRKMSKAILGCLMMSIAGMPLAYAGCMDDAGDALAAVFTGGASVAICQTVETIQSLIRTVQTVIGSMERITRETITTAQRAVNETTSSIVTNTNNAMRQFSTMVSDANRMASAVAQQHAHSTISAANLNPARMANLQSHSFTSAQQHALQAHSSTLAPTNEVQTVMRQAANTLSQMQSTLTRQTVNQILGAAEHARNMAQRHADSARRIAETSVMAPLHQLEGMLGDLANHPERIFDPTSLVNESVERITRAMTQVTEQIHHEIMGEALATIGDIDQDLRRLTSDSQQAENIHSAMARLEHSRDQQSLNNLRRLLGIHSQMANAGGVRAGSAALTASNFGGYSSVLTRLRTVSHTPNNNITGLINSLKHGNTTLKTTQRMATSGKLQAGVKQRAKAELDRMLQNKSPAQVAAIKRRLKQQLSGKLHNNRKAMMELNSHFDQRFLALSGNRSVITKPVVKQSPVLMPSTMLHR